MEYNKIKWYHQELIPCCTLKGEKNPCSVLFRSQTRPIRLAKRSPGLDPNWHSPSPSTTLLWMLRGKPKRNKLIIRGIMIDSMQVTSPLMPSVCNKLTYSRTEILLGLLAIFPAVRVLGTEEWHRRKWAKMEKKNWFLSIIVMDNK